MPNHSEDHFAELYSRYRSDVWLYCRRRLGSDRADDAMGDVFLTAWRRIEEAPAAPDALRWLYRIAYLTVSNHWRSAGRKRRLKARVEAIGVTPPNPIADQVVVRDEVRTVVDLLTKLKTSDAEILRLAAWEQLTTAQIAAVLDISPDAAKQRLSRARQRLVSLHDRTKPVDSSPPMLGKEVRGEH
ncbi:MAG: RNA polymerase sigma factor [Acidimicrobiia bacterium]